MLAGRRVLLGVTGGIACYKSVDLCSRLRKAGAEVRVVMTENARAFVQPLTFQSISGNPVAVDLFATPAEQAVEHIWLAEWGELTVVAPATADVLGKLAHGIADDYLSTVMLAFAGSALLVPAMNRFMYAHPAVQASMRALVEMGYRVMPAEYGHLAEGVSGWGRMPEPPAIVEALSALAAENRPPRLELPPPPSATAASPGSPPGPHAAGSPGLGSSPSRTRDLAGVRIVVTAGPTQEPIDPVRFISNPSSGKTGWALAEAARARGAEVTLVAGPVLLPDPPGVRVHRVRTAVEMAEAAMAAYEGADVAICAAAVSDFRPEAPAPEKIKKGESPVMSLHLVRNPDILASMGERKGRRVLVGFAAEAGAGPDEAERKRVSKGADLIVYNDVRAPGLGFGAADNAVVIVGAGGLREAIGPLPKRELADRILDRVATLRQGSQA
ncbi:MAG TPA: bifunctional phosphopantothenoylcysteine decarboxylase/phosphopantothenate synthase [Bacillota bacterium]|nr:bifunctional phosphopantothenoylcysteine decarboxylase/phosphopantothenate synthase [Bacillota bacterium]